MSQFLTDEQRAERDLEKLLKRDDTPESNDQNGAVPGASSTPAASEPPQQSDDGYRQRYLTLQGIMKSERANWQAEKEKLLLRIKSLEESQNRNANEPLEVADDYRSTLVTDEMRQSLPYRRMLEVNGQRYTELHFETIAHTENARQPAEQPANDKAVFFAQLGRLAKNWQTLNNDDGFNDFLDKVLPYSGGMTYRDKLSEAVQNNDAPAAAQFFLDYEEQLLSARSTQAPDEHVAPPRRGSETHTSADNNKGKVYTRKEWDALWKKLEYDNMPAADAHALETELTIAMGEGRVVG